MAVQEIPRPCRICRKLTLNKNGYCKDHEHIAIEREQMQQARHDLRRGTPSSRGYDSTWVKVRKTYLLQHPLCEECEKHGRVMPAAEVHHKVALRDGGARLDPDNLMAVCRACHQQFTQEEISNRRKNTLDNLHG